MVLTAQLQKFVKKNGTNNQKTRNHQTRNPKTPRSTQSNNNNNQESTKPAKPTWLINHEKPPDNDLQTLKEWNSVKWHWCCPETGGKCDGKWRVHSPKECKGLMRNNKGKDN